jgi:hypothetical protein
VEHVLLSLNRKHILEIEISWDVRLVSFLQKGNRFGCVNSFESHCCCFQLSSQFRLGETCFGQRTNTDGLTEQIAAIASWWLQNCVVYPQLLRRLIHVDDYILGWNHQPCCVWFVSAVLKVSMPGRAVKSVRSCAFFRWHKHFTRCKM